MVDKNNQLFKDLTQKIELYSFSPITIKGINIQYLDITQLEEKMQNLSKIVVNSINLCSLDLIYFLFFSINEIFIIDEIIVKQNRDFFKRKSLEFLFYSDLYKNDFNNIVDTQETSTFSSQQQKAIKIQDNKQIIIKVIDFLITRSKNMTKEMYQKMNFSSLKIRNDFKRNDFVIIEHLGYNVDLCFNINDQLLYVLKCYDKSDDQEIQFQREKSFYKAIGNKNKFISKFFGSIKDVQNYIVIEYIEGETLKDFILKNEINEIEQIKIILEIIFTVKYIHDKRFFLRDLKFDNIMIDSNKNAMLIDFDLTKECSDDTKKTASVGSEYFSSPEQCKNNQYSFESDIFSLGMIINFILTKKEYQQRLYDENGNILNFDIMKEQPSKYWDYKSLKFLVMHCLNYSPKSRLSIDSLIILVLNYLKINYPKISEMIKVIENLYFYYFGMIEIPSKISNLKICKKLPNFDELCNDAYNIYCIMIESKNSKEIRCLNIKMFNDFIKQIKIEANKEDLNTEIYNISESIDQKFIDKEYCFQNINEIILNLNEINCDKYLNYTNIQYELAKIYYENIIIQVDIKKAISYFTLCADHDHILAQYHLGVIYIEEKYISLDINKSIHYFTLAANQNHKYAQFYLGYMFCYIHSIHNIQKSIHYLSLAARQGVSIAYYYLGIIYYNGKYISKDINKAIYYLCHASDLNDVNAQIQLGIIYDIGKDTNKAIYYLTLAANQDQVDSQYCLGFLYLKGIYVSQDKQKAIHYLTLAAENNHIESQYILGTLYLQGCSISRNVEKGIHYLTRAANQNHVEAQYNLGTFYFISRDFDKAIHFLTLAANQNIVDAQVNLGVIYSESEFIQPDINKAIHYLTLAANQNNKEAQYNLGTIYYDGKNIRPDINKAIYYFTLAAKQNYARAQYSLGVLYSIGKYIKPEIDKAIYYFLQASDQKIVQAYYNLGCLYFNYKNFFPDAINRAIHFFTLAADQNDEIDAQNKLGILYYSKDVNKSIYYFSRAASKGLADAQYNLGYIYFSSKRIFNPKKFIHYFSLAAKQNNANAQFFLGNFYLHGFFVEQNIFKGIDFLNLSTKNGNKDGHFILGFLYHEGKYIDRDIIKSLHHYKEVSSFYNNFAKNNIGILYKHGFNDKIPKIINSSIEYFEEAIRQKKDKVSMYNLAHLYLYEEPNKENIEQSIDLLIRSIKIGFLPSKNLLCLALIKKCGLNIEYIKETINKYGDESNNISSYIYEMIQYYQLNGETAYENDYNHYKTIDFLYNDCYSIIKSKSIFNQKIKENQINNSNIKNITSEFYEGFGIE